MKQLKLVILCSLAFHNALASFTEESSQSASMSFLPFRHDTVRLLAYEDLPKDALSEDQLKDGGFLLYLIGRTYIMQYLTLTF